MQWTAQSPSLGHYIGCPDQDGWSVNTGQDRPNWIQFGPYTAAVSVGHHTATWKFLIDNNSQDNAPVLRLEVADFTTGQTVLASRMITRKQWTTTGAYECFTVPFTIDG